MRASQQQRTVSASTAVCFCHTFLCPRHAAPSSGSHSHPASSDGEGELEGRQSPGSAARRVFWLRWRGDTPCNCACILPPRHRRVNSHLQPVAVPASLSHWAGSGGTDAGWNRRAVGQRGVPGVSHSPAMSSHPAGPASCCTARCPGAHAHKIPSKIISAPAHKILSKIISPSLGLGCPEQQSPRHRVSQAPANPTHKASLHVAQSFLGRSGTELRCQRCSVVARQAQTAGRSREGPEPGWEASVLQHRGVP